MLMIRKSMKMWLCALLAAFTLSSIAEAAPKKALRHRTKHSSRVSSSGAATAGKQPATKKKAPTAPAAKKKSGTNASKPTAKKSASAKRRPTTKPR
jgi:hypothetical protein